VVNAASRTLATYVRRAALMLAGQHEASVLAGQLEFPSVSAKAETLP
jgi:hypothetical protein